MIFDMHQHYDFGGDIDAYCKGMRGMKIKIGLSAGGPEFGQKGNTGVKDAFTRYPDVVTGFYLVDFRKDTAENIEKAHKEGFRGVKLIFPHKPYDDESFYPLYKKAQELKMPCLFHTGPVARLDWVVEHFFLQYPEVKAAYEKTDYAGMGIKSYYMDPYAVEPIARAFPKLIIVMAHFGIGNRDVARIIIQANNNVFGDVTHFCGHFTKADVKEAVKFFEPVVNKYVTEKIVFGTDNMVSMGYAHIKKSIKSATDVMHAFKFKESTIKEIMGNRFNSIMNGTYKMQ